MMAIADQSRYHGGGVGQSRGPQSYSIEQSPKYQVDRRQPQARGPQSEPREMYDSRYRMNNHELNRVTPYDRNQYNKNYRSNRDPYVRSQPNRR